LIGNVTVQDPTAYERHRNELGDLIARHGGEYIVRGGEIEVVSRDWRPNRLIILKFPDKSSVRDYLNDPRFHRSSELRRRATKCQIVMVEGVGTATTGSV
jgi:uncharacterized protein (DUF1330 family)